jgi:ribulose-phosphate 3-epimerase
MTRVMSGESKNFNTSMKIIPVINCQDFECVQSRIEIMQGFACDHGSSARTTVCDCWVHIDVADGGFTDGYTTWRNPEDLKRLRRDPHLKIEVHLMLNEPELALESWLGAGIHRIIVHLETVEAFDTVANICAQRGVETWLAIGPQTAAEKAFPYLGLAAGCQVLAVHPGLPGQEMEPATIEKVVKIRAAFSKLPIEVDGGVNLETVKSLAAAGVSQAVAGSVIFNAPEPAVMYQQLLSVASE